MSIEEIHFNLRNNIQKKRTFSERFKKDQLEIQKYFEGYLNNNYFEIQKVINYRNSFLPQIKGIIKNEDRKTNIQLFFRVHLLVLIFMIIWLSGVSFGLIISIISLFYMDGYIMPILALLVMLLGGLFIIVYGFNLEYNKSKTEIIKILKEKTTSCEL